MIAAARWPALVAMGLLAGLGCSERPAAMTPTPNAASSGVSPASPSRSGPPPAPSPPSAGEIEATVAARPDDYSLRMQAAQLYMAIGQHGSAIVHLVAATRLQPKELVAWLALGDARVLVGDTGGARAAYQQARRLAPDQPLVDRGLGQVLIKEEKLQEARALLSAALRRHPANLDLRLALGNLYLVMNRPPLAVAVLEPAAASSSATADAHYLLGQAYEANLRIQAALAAQRKAVAADPNFAEAWGRIGLYLIDLTRYAEARPPLERAIQLNPREPHYHWALGNSYLQDASDPGHLNRAIEHYRHALALDARHERALVSLGIALTRRAAPGDVAAAAETLGRAVALNPSNPTALYQRAQAQLAMGQTAAARESLARFRRLEARTRRDTARRFQTVSFVDDAKFHVRLGRRHLADGRLDLAATEFRLALQRDPALQSARSGLVEIEKRRSAGGRR